MAKKQGTKSPQPQSCIRLFMNALGRKLTLGQHVETALYGGPIEETPETHGHQAKAPPPTNKM